MPPRLAPEDVRRLGELVGLRFPEEDLEPLTEALAGHLAFVAPLLAADLAEADSALVHDPRWRA